MDFGIPALLPPTWLADRQMWYFGEERWFGALGFEPDVANWVPTCFGQCVVGYHMLLKALPTSHAADLCQ